MKRSVHDLKSPIGGISGYLELMNVCLNSDGDVNKMDRYRAQIDKGLDEINSIVNQLHEVTKENFDIDGDDYLNKADVCGIVECVCKNMKELCGQKNIELEYKNPGESLYLPVDVVLLKLTLMNLTCNAIKYTAKPGKIAFQITKTEKEAYIHVKSDKTAHPGKDIKRNFLEELSNTHDHNSDSTLDSSPYYFGTNCIPLIYEGATMTVGSSKSNGFTVQIRFGLPVSITQ